MAAPTCYECGEAANEEKGDLVQCPENPKHWFHSKDPCKSDHLNWISTDPKGARRARHTGRAAGIEASLVEMEDSGADRFAYEQDLRDYLEKNPGVIERGMCLWPVGDGESAVEYCVEGDRRIDILARDRNGIPVIIELKVSRGHERVIGQALYYRGCIKEKFVVPKARIIIIAREITPELKTATNELADVELFEYKLSVNLTKIAPAHPAH